MKILLKILVCGIIFLLLVVTALGSENKGNTRDDNYPAKYYGVIEQIPNNGLEGIWIVNNREILVTSQTKIDEEYGKAEVGAYVEVEGNYLDETFTAYEIEVIRDKQ
jgi:hypothetical protein